MKWVWSGLAVLLCIGLPFNSLAMARVNVAIVNIGNPGNPGELSGDSVGVGGAGPDRICGAVGYIYWMGKFEVTAAQYTEFLNAVARTDTYGLYNTKMADPSTKNVYGCNIQRYGSPGGYTYTVAPDWANRPVNWIDWGDAARFTNWLTNGQPTGGQGLTTTEDGSYFLNGATSDAQLYAVTRKPGARYVIPSEDEWYKAAYYDPNRNPWGGGYWNYPTRSESAPGNELLTPDPGNMANYDGGADFTIGPPYYRTEVGEFERSAGPYGTFDQAGNVFEWTEGKPYPGRTDRLVRGGGFDSGGLDAYAGVRWGNYSPTTAWSSFGFRVAVVPEPGALGLLVLGGLAVLRRRQGGTRRRRSSQPT